MQMQARMGDPEVLLPEVMKALSALKASIPNIDVWKRLNVAVRQPAGEWKG